MVNYNYAAERKREVSYKPVEIKLSNDIKKNQDLGMNMGINMGMDDFSNDAEQNRNIDLCELNDLITGTPDQAFHQHIQVEK